VFKPNGEALGRNVARGNPGMDAPLGSRRIPNSTGWFERHRSDQNFDNDFKIDREAQRTGESFTGIAGIRIQDCAVTESMGKINDRTIEHLGTTDQFIIRVRRKLMAMARALEERGETPVGVDTPEVYRQRSGEMVLPRATDWWSAYEQMRENWEKVVVKEAATSNA
jgi:phthalate 4,5-dioxygenase